MTTNKELPGLNSVADMAELFNTSSLSPLRTSNKNREDYISDEAYNEIHEWFIENNGHDYAFEDFLNNL